MSDQTYNLDQDAIILTPRDMYARPVIRLPQVDMLVSKIVGKKIFTHDPRLIKLVVKWKRNKPMDSLEPDNFLKNENFIKELKQVLGGSL